MQFLEKMQTIRSIVRGKSIESLEQRNRIYLDLITIRSKGEIALNAIHDLLDEVVTAQSILANKMPPVK